MRAFKFRAWDSLAGIMIADVAHRQRGGLEVMQYTGCSDRNGIDIYEGDILKGIVGSWAVEWLDSGCWNFVGTSAPELEVIGNIHENPELLQAA